MEKMRRCLVMMALYNGEKYLKEQMESLLHQSYSCFDLYAQDDGSEDDTWKIMEKYAAEDPRIHLRRNETGNHGPYQNYNALFNYCRSLQAYDLYLFCDQDDVWDQDKLEKLIAFYDRNVYDAGIPVMIQGNFRIIDGDGKVTIPDMDENDHIRRDGLSMYFDAATWGCNVIFNRALFEDIALVPDRAKRVWGHDQYLARWACVRGRMLFDPEVTISYRRSGKNVTSDHAMQVTTKRVLSRIAKLDQLAHDHAVSYKSALFVLEKLSATKELTDHEKDTVQALERCIQYGGIGAVLFFRQYHIDLGKKVRTLSHLLILVTGMYRKYLEQIE